MWVRTGKGGDRLDDRTGRAASSRETTMHRLRQLSTARATEEGKRAAEGREGDDDARARVPQRASGGDGDYHDTILYNFSAPRCGDRPGRKPSPRCCLVRDRGRCPPARFPYHYPALRVCVLPVGGGIRW